MSGKPVTDLVTGRIAVTALLKKGPKSVVLTMGGAGVLFTEMSDSEIHHIPAQNVNVIDTTVSIELYHINYMCMYRALGMLLWEH